MILMKRFCFSSGLFLFIALSVIIKQPCANPQKIKLKAAPCHKPVVKNTVKRFMAVRTFPFRFPPNGIYT